jgi:hypothetical protein
MQDGIFPSGKNCSADNDGDYDFSNRFPNAIGMINNRHAEFFSAS